MAMASVPTILCMLLAAFELSHAAWTNEKTCDSRDYQACIAMADPLIRDSRLVFPDNMGDIDQVCRTWAQFVDCVKRYTERCFSPARRQQFNQAVQRSVDSVHQMCTQTPYQAEYLSHAACIKSTLTEEAHCGSQYRHLADIVAGQQPVTSRVHICCSHHWFRECVLRETRVICDKGITGSATRFATHILDKALSFLHEDCTNYIPTNGECPTNSDVTQQPPRVEMNQQQQQEVRGPGDNMPSSPRYPTPRNRFMGMYGRDSSRFQLGRSSRLPLDGITSFTSGGGGGSPFNPDFSSPPPPSPASPSYSVPFNAWNPTPSAEATPWTPSRMESSPGGINDVNVPASTPGSMGGMMSSTEAPSAGGGWNKEPTPMTWGDTSTRISGHGDGGIYIHSTESWYPEAGIHNGIIDEPNQQGLGSERGGAQSWIQISITMLFISMSFALLL